eukprot:NODE_264_length_12431_cov_0.389556.p5 type:complete len:148 gc:universal NODE_264_length_12431_cov_0.389556:3677-4120(+)
MLFTILALFLVSNGAVPPPPPLPPAGIPPPPPPGNSPSKGSDATGTSGAPPSSTAFLLPHVPVSSDVAANPMIAVNYFIDFMTKPSSGSPPLPPSATAVESDLNNLASVNDTNSTNSTSKKESKSASSDLNRSMTSLAVFTVILFMN